MPPVPRAPVNTDEGPRIKNKADAGRRLAELDAQLVRHLPTSELEALLRITSGLVETLDEGGRAAGSPTISPVTGRRASTALEVVSAQRENLLRGFAVRRSMLDGALTSTEVADMLGSATRQTPHDRVSAGTLLALKDGGKLRYPIWQFDPEGPDGIVEGLPEVLAALPSLTQLARLTWFMTPQPALGKRTPITALRDREIDAVVAAAGALHSG